MLHIFIPTNYIRKNKNDKKGGIFIPDLSSKNTKVKKIQPKSGLNYTVNSVSNKTFGVEKIEKNKNKNKKFAESDLMNNLCKNDSKENDVKNQNSEYFNDNEELNRVSETFNESEIIEKVKEMSLKELAQNNQNIKKSNLQMMFEEKIDYQEIKMLEKLEEESKIKDENNNVESFDLNKEKPKGKGGTKKNKQATNLQINLKFG